MDFLTVIIIIIGIGLIITGFIGCIVPGLPGPPFNYLALILLKLVVPDVFTGKFLLTLGIITFVVYLLDYVLPLMGAKIFKASKWGIWGSIIGMIIGVFFFPPFGMIIGLLLGAIAGELLAGKSQSEALKVGFISFLFSLFAIIIKLGLSAVLSYYFFKAVFEMST